ncbi:MAG TPA: phosphate ABC transporter ATP-binding protein [Candidatus Saccharicenans sp.]|nr:phosphate ABC transporter ATP-binding protein [Candidatus Saccharicenans sp.]HQO75271.1 phosphate ABC transporter ATP-binding protein [Candidatus Saccharicenans sp.]HUM78463.1 phosphate ABC transporter ATP-binding protein [Candidatus Saccharicenans sp.]
MVDNGRLILKNVSVYYGQNQVLKNISLNIPDKSLTVIIGPSGCGKSTLLKSLNRLLDEVEEARVEGQILLDNQNIYGRDVDVTQIRKKMGLLSQKPQVLPMSIYDNIAFGLKLHRSLKKSELNRLVEKYLKLAGLWEEVQDRLNEPASRLSIGQQQRLCLARGLAVEPEIILGDEPTSALDPQSSRNVEAQLQSLKKNYAIVVVTHILRQAKRLADYVAFLYMGELIEFGPASEVLTAPQDPRTRAYITGEIS